MSRFSRTLSLFALLICPSITLAEQTKLDITCPCEFGSVSSSAITFRAGVLNRDSKTSAALRVSVVATTQPAYQDDVFFTIGQQNVATTAGPGATLPITVYQDDRGQLPAGTYHITLLLEEMNDGEFTRVDSIRMRDPVTVTASGLPAGFVATNIEVLQDDDQDGVSNFNERLTGTDPANPASIPPASSIDVLVIYSQGVPALYGGDPTARIDQAFSTANAVLQSSSVPITLNVVGRVQKTMNESLDLGPQLNLADNRQSPFDDLDQLKAQTGADLVLLYMPIVQSSQLCGLATLGGESHKGDFVSTNNERFANSAVWINIDECPDDTTIHELGHLMGLDHSRPQSAAAPEGQRDGGTFPWALGYGVDSGFHTVMAYPEFFGGAPLQLVFGSPELICNGVPCGIARTDIQNGADAKLAVDTSRFQIARYRAAPGGGTDTDGDGTPDSTDSDDDNDGVPDSEDAFRTDASESLDTDMDGTGDNADTDDDNDGVPDASDAFPRDAARSTDDSGTPARLAPPQEIALSIAGKGLTSTNGSTLTVPANATAVALNVTAVSPSAAGFVTVYPCGVSRPLASNLNFVGGDVVPNGVIAPIGADGTVCLYSQAGTDLVVDAAGWFQGTSFVGATPKRLVDTRDGTGLIGGPQRVDRDNVLSFKVTDLSAQTAAGATTTVPGSIRAAALNVTVVNPDAAGFVTVYPCDVSRPLTSNVNYSAGQVVANGVIAPVAADGTFCIYSLEPSDIVVDLAGWFPGAAFTPSTPQRFVDTRDGTGGQLGKLTAASQLNMRTRGEVLTVDGQPKNVPTTATAAALNVTVVNPEAAGFATIWPCSAERPLASNLNFVAGQVVANNVIAPIGDAGTICFYTNVPADIVVDVAGYFSGSADAFVGATPRRFVDTREGRGPAPQ